MSDTLSRIVAIKREHVAAQKKLFPRAELEARARSTAATRGFSNALDIKAENGFALIAEIKKASPSVGLIRADFNPTNIAIAYENGGAACLSVLTDTPFFQGADNYLIEARKACKLPVLRKDFMVDPYQIYESRSLGADCILLIMACLEDTLAEELEAAAHSLNMDVLIEVHDEEELGRALKHLKSPLLGVNNRNLKTLKVDVKTCEKLAQLVPSDRKLVGESGFTDHLSLCQAASKGIRRFLVGESLMRQTNIEVATQNLLNGGEN